MPELAELLAVLELDRVDDRAFRATCLGEDGAVAFGGELVGQTIVATRTVLPSHTVKTAHTTFARSAIVGRSIELDVDVMHEGRTFASATVSVSQDGRLCSRSLVLASSAEPDLLRHGAPPPAVDGPADLPRTAGTPDWWEVRTVDDVDVHDPAVVRPAELFMWSRFPGAPSDPTIAQALLAYASDGFLLGTTMLPHAGIGMEMAHRTISTTVLSHTLTFHEAFDAGDWLLIALESPYAGGGRSYGRAHVYTEDGALVASFVQDAMLRAFPDDAAPEAGRAARH